MTGYARALAAEGKGPSPEFIDHARNLRHVVRLRGRFRHVPPETRDGDGEARHGSFLLAPVDVARVLGVHVCTVRRLGDRGELHITRIGRRTLFHPADVLDYIERSRAR